MENNATYKLRFSAPRWSGIIEFLKREANYLEVDLKLEFSNSFFTTSGSFVCKGSEKNVLKFKSIVEESFKKYNDE